MKSLSCLFIVIFIFGCNKDRTTHTGCNIQQAYADNAKKVTITNGIWGTVSSMEGNCMPVVSPTNSTCKNCPVKRTVKIYQYTLFSNATPSGNSTIFFDSFNTPLVAEVNTDDNGFFQVNIPSGNYTIAVVENGKLYANERDGQGGLNPFSFSSGAQNVNVTMRYKAVF
ncbi:MAG: hypothetical protein ABR503_03235 [Chitinophagaceae bacterium]